MQEGRKTTDVLGTYRDCGIMGLLSFLLGKILILRSRRLLVEPKRRIRVASHVESFVSVIAAVRPARADTLDE
jgi:hypothetical protein